MTGLCLSFFLTFLRYKIEQDRAKKINIARAILMVPKTDSEDVGLTTLLDLDGEIFAIDEWYWVKFEIDTKPSSVTDLERATNRKKSSLSRTLKTMEKYGIVKLVKKAGRIVPQVKATDFKVEFASITARQPVSFLNWHEHRHTSW